MAMALKPEAASRVSELLKLIDANDRVVQHWEELIGTLREAGMAWTAQVEPDAVGVHPRNRSGEGLNVGEVHVHGADLVSQGFSWSKASDAMAIEAPLVDTPEYQNAVTFNNDLAENSCGMLPPLRCVRLLSIGGAHTNGFLRVLRSRCATLVPSLQGEDGMIDATRIMEKDGHLKDAVAAGLHCTVISRNIVELFPTLPEVGQSILNAKAGCENSEIEVMLALHRAAVSRPKLGVAYDWERAMQSALRNNPPCRGYIRAIAEFVKVNAGGAQGELLQDRWGVSWHVLRVDACVAIANERD